MEGRTPAPRVHGRPTAGLLASQAEGNRCVLGGFKRSSQHPEVGGCDGHSKAAFGQVRTSPLPDFSLSLQRTTQLAFCNRRHGFIAVLAAPTTKGPGRGVPGEHSFLAGVLIDSSGLSSFAISYKRVIYTYYLGKLNHGDHSEASGGISKGVPGDGVIGAEPAKPVGAVS